MKYLLRRLGYLAAAIASVLVFGTAGFVLIDHYPLFDAFYMALITITTVGYFEVHTLSQAGRVFNSVLLIVGVSMLFLAVGVLAQTVIEMELGDIIGKRRLRRMIEKLENHYIICGFGRVGRGAAQEMHRSQVPFVVVDRETDKVERAIKLGYLAVLADSTEDETLHGVHVAKALGLVAALTTDADNLFLILSAKVLNPRLKIASRANDLAAESKLRRAGADVAFAPYNMTGFRLAQAILRPHVEQFMDFFSRKMGMAVAMEQVHVAESFRARSLKEMQVRRELGVIVLAISKGGGEMQFNPPADALVAGGDFLIVMGQPESLGKLERLLEGAAA